MGESISNFKLQNSNTTAQASLRVFEKQSLNVTEIASRSALAMTDSSNFKIPNEIRKI